MAFVISFCFAACQMVVVFVCNNLITSRGIWLKERSLHVRTKYTGGWNHVNGWLFSVLSLAMIHLTVLKLLTTFSAVFFSIYYFDIYIYFRKCYAEFNKLIQTVCQRARSFENWCWAHHICQQFCLYLNIFTFSHIKSFSCYKILLGL